MSDEKRRDTRDSRLGGPVADDNKGTASRARNRTVLLSPEHIGQIRATLSDDVPAAPEEPAGNAASGGNWDADAEKGARQRRDTERDGAEGGFKPVLRGFGGDAEPRRPAPAAPPPPPSQARPTPPAAAAEPPRQANQSFAAPPPEQSQAPSGSQPIAAASSASAPGQQADRGARPRTQSAFHRILGTSDSSSSGSEPPPQSASFSASREAPRETPREAPRYAPEPQQQQRRYESSPQNGPLNAEHYGHEPERERHSHHAPPPPPPPQAKAETGVRAVSKGPRQKLVGFLVSYDTDPLGEVLELRVGRWLVTSRPTDQGDYVLIDDPTISPLHAILRSGADGQVRLLDQLSEHGSGIVRSGKSEEETLTGSLAQVNHGDSVRLGKRHFCVCLLPRTKG
jgi:hypothetical protein